MLHPKGETRKEALENVKEAAELYLEVQKHKHPVLPHVEVLPLEA